MNYKKFSIIFMLIANIVNNQVNCSSKDEIIEKSKQLELLSIVGKPNTEGYALEGQFPDKKIIEIFYSKMFNPPLRGIYTATEQRLSPFETEIYYTVLNNLAQQKL